MPIVTSRLDAVNRLGRAMADPTRSSILLRLIEGACYPAELAQNLQLTRSNVSNHLTCLRGCGLVVATPEGRQTRYQIADPRLTRALISLVDVVLSVDGRTPCGNAGCDLLCCCGVTP